MISVNIQIDESNIFQLKTYFLEELLIGESFWKFQDNILMLFIQDFQDLSRQGWFTLEQYD